MVKFVRLACLMCAASVYPEPGSNSLIIYNLSFSNSLNFNLFWFGSFYSTARFCYSFRIYYLLFNVLSFCSFSVWNVLDYTTLQVLCQYFFKKFYIFYISTKIKSSPIQCICSHGIIISLLLENKLRNLLFPPGTIIEVILPV